MLGEGVTYYVYDESGEAVGLNSGFASLSDTPFIDGSIALDAGTYLITSQKSYDYENSKGIVYYLSSGINIPSLTFDSEIYIGFREAFLYKFSFNEARNIMYTTSSSSLTFFD